MKENIRKFAIVVLTGDGAFVHHSRNSECPTSQFIEKTDIQVQTLRGHIKKSHGRTYVSFGNQSHH